MKKPKKEVVIIQSRCPRFRTPFFNMLRSELNAKGVDLRLLYGVVDDNAGVDPAFYEALPWAEPFKLRYLPLRRRKDLYRVPGYGEHVSRVTWHPVLREVIRTDLVIVEAATRYPLNYLLFILRKFGGPKLAFWGHGWNHQTYYPNSISERIKTWIGKRADWYFAYTSEVRDGLIQRGYDPARVTDVQNAVQGPNGSEASELSKQDLRRELGLDGSEHIALYCGRMYASKRLDFLVRAAVKVRERLPSFVLILAGAGPDKAIAMEAAAQYDFIHYVEPIFDDRKSTFFSISRVVAMPGIVGLGIVDAFHFGVPPVTTACPFHGPEAAYVHDGRNGIVADDNIESFAECIWRVLIDDDLHSQLASGCRVAANEITVEEMAGRFSRGILSALA